MDNNRFKSQMRHNIEKAKEMVEQMKDRALRKFPDLFLDDTVNEQLPGQSQHGKQVKTQLPRKIDLREKLKKSGNMKSDHLSDGSPAPNMTQRKFDLRDKLKKSGNEKSGQLTDERPSSQMTQGNFDLREKLKKSGHVNLANGSDEGPASQIIDKTVQTQSCQETNRQPQDFITFIDNHELKSDKITTAIRIEPSTPSDIQCNEELSPEKWLYTEDSAEDVIRYIEDQNDIYKVKRNEYIEKKIREFQNPKKVVSAPLESKDEQVISVQDPMFIDSSKIKNVKTILKEVTDRSAKKWHVIGSDEAIYYKSAKLIKKNKDLQNILLLPGLGHYDQNIRKVMFRLMGDVAFYKLQAEVINPKSTSRRDYYKPESTHDAWVILQTFLEATLKELLSPYVDKDRQYSADDLEEYINESENVNFKFIANFTLEYVLAFYLFREAINENDHEKLIASKCKVADLFYGPYNMWGYRFTELRDNITRAKLKDKSVADFLKRNESVRMPNKKYKREGGDTVLEFVNATIKNRMNRKRQPKESDWQRECMNVNKELQNYRNDTHFLRSDSTFDEEFMIERNVDKWLDYLRNCDESTHLKRNKKESVYRSFTGTELDEGLDDFFTTVRSNRRKYIRNNLSHTNFTLKKIFVRKRVDIALRKKNRCSIARCKRSFRTIKLLKHHIKVVHFKAVSHLCSYCHASFQQRGDLRAHIKLHTRERPFVCPLVECGKSFMQTPHLKRHLLTHEVSTKKEKQETDIRKHEISAESEATAIARKRNVPKPTIKSVACNVPTCKQKFRTRAHLQVHIKVVHFNIKNHFCPYCQDEFKLLSHLKDHIMTHTGHRKYRCDVEGCGRSFRQIAHLKSHERTHTGKRPYKCDVEGCGKSFRQTAHLNSHKLTHTEERPYKCEDCGKSFRQTAHLKGHKRTHTGERPYKCNVEGCGKSFRQTSHLKRHKRTHTGNYTPFMYLRRYKLTHTGNYAPFVHLRRHKLTANYAPFVY